MIEMDLERDKPFIEKEFACPAWDETSGLAPEVLEARCREIWKNTRDESIQLRRAKIFCFIIRNAQLAVHPFDCFADQLRHGHVLAKLTGEWHKENAEPLMNDLSWSETMVKCRAMTGERDYGHTCPDWHALLTLGYPGILTRLREYQQKSPAAQENEFFACCIMVYEALLDYIRRLAAAARKQATAAPRMSTLADTLIALTEGAPQTLHQALQLSFITYTLQQEIEGAIVRVLGRFDVLYNPFYEADLAAGRITESQAMELMQYYFLRWNARDVVANIPITLCGCDSDGSQTANAMTRLVLKAYSSMDLISPKFHIRYSTNLPQDVLDTVLRMIRAGSNSFVFCNDEIYERGLTAIGQLPQDARDYVLVGCYESTAPGREVACTCNGRISIPKAVEYAMTGGVDMLTGEQAGAKTSTDLPSFDTFMDAVRQQLVFLADACVRRVSRIERDYPLLFSAPLFSAGFASCLEKGKDIFAGGAVYNNSSVNAFGLATAADSAAAIRCLVYEEKSLSLADFVDILRADWKDHEKLRLRCIKKMPKYGINHTQTDALAVDMLHTVASRITGVPNGRGGVFRCGAFSIDWRFEFGAHTAASADGRHAGEALSKNLCASLGADTEGVTALLTSAAKIDTLLLPNGAVLDVMLHKSAMTGQEGLNAMSNLVHGYMQSGGQAIQFNVMDATVLRRAQAVPEQYPNLQVRLCGWNVRFVNLSRQEQDELIQQAEA